MHVLHFCSKDFCIGAVNFIWVNVWWLCVYVWVFDAHRNLSGDDKQNKTVKPLPVQSSALGFPVLDFIILLTLHKNPKSYEWSQYYFMTQKVGQWIVTLRNYSALLTNVYGKSLESDSRTKSAMKNCGKVFLDEVLKTSRVKCWYWVAKETERNVFPRTTTWKRSLEKELRENRHTWSEIERLAVDQWDGKILFVTYAPLGTQSMAGEKETYPPPNYSRLPQTTTDFHKSHDPWTARRSKSE